MKNKKLNQLYIVLSIVLLSIILSSCKNNKVNTNDNCYVNDSKDIQPEDIDVIFLDTIYFDYNSYQLDNNSKKNLNILIREMNKYKTKTITIYGYCDIRGTNNYNYNLGLQRAKEVKKYLINNNITTDRISIESFGKEKQTINVNKSKEENFRLNRKVMIKFNNNLNK